MLRSSLLLLAATALTTVVALPEPVHLVSEDLHSHLQKRGAESATYVSSPISDALCFLVFRAQLTLLLLVSFVHQNLTVAHINDVHARECRLRGQPVRILLIGA